MGDPADLPEDMIDSSLRDQEYMPFIPESNAGFPYIPPWNYR